MNQRRQSDSKLHKATKMTEVVAIWFAIIAGIFSLYFFVDAWKADKTKVTAVEIELRQEILDTDIDRNAKIMHHYDQKAMEGELTQSEKNRVKYIQSQLDRQYAEQERLREMEDELE